MGKCNISRDNPLLNENESPHMIEDCYSDDSWNLPDFDDKCCQGTDVCRPTIEGGYCVQERAHGNQYYKYKHEMDEDGNKIVRMPYNINRGIIGRETPYSEDTDDAHMAGIDDLKELQNEFYNELMINRIRSTEPTVIERNLEKEELQIQEMVEDDLRNSEVILKQEVVQATETNYILKILLGLMVLLGFAFLLFYFVDNEGHKGKGNKKLRPLGQASSKGSKGSKGSKRSTKLKGLNIDIKDILKNFRNYFK